MIPSLRPATPDDIPTLLEIEQRCFADPNWGAEDFLKYVCTVAEVQGRIAGFIVVRETCPSHGEAPAEREVLNLAVDSPSRRFGLATTLLESELQSGASYCRQPAETAIVMQKK